MLIEIHDLVVTVKIVPSDTESDLVRRQRDKRDRNQPDGRLQPLFTEAETPEVLRRKDERWGVVQYWVIF